MLKNVHVARYVELNTNFMTQVPDLNAALSPDLIEIVLIGCVGEMQDAAKLIDTFPRRSELNVLRTEYIARDLCLLDLVAARTDKGRAVHQMAQHLGIPQETVMAIGDNHSDLDMLRYAAYPVVMGNATDELKSQGWPLTDTNDDEGVAKAIDRYIVSQNPMQ